MNQLNCLLSNIKHQFPSNGAKKLLCKTPQVHRQLISNKAMSGVLFP